jgi:hypothetical protein
VVCCLVCSCIEEGAAGISARANIKNNFSRVVDPGSVHAKYILSSQKRAHPPLLHSKKVEKRIKSTTYSFRRARLP